MKAQLPLTVIAIPRPCPRRWNQLRGDGRVRYCDACGKGVHNLSALSPGDAERFVAANPGACVALDVDPAGRVVPLAYAEPRYLSPWRRWWIWALALAGVCAAAAQFVFGTGGIGRPFGATRVMGAMVCPPGAAANATPQGRSLLGKVEGSMPDDAAAVDHS